MVSLSEPNGARLKYFVPNNGSLWRVKTLLTKEPATIDWLNSMSSDSVLLDVGANIGIYSIYAALVRGSKVYAFEPESQNYSSLQKNIILNEMEKKVFAFCASISDMPSINFLNLSDFVWDGAGSCNSYGEEVSFDLTPRKSDYRQGSVAINLDSFLASIAPELPTHLKVDVDGFEHKVIYGGANLLLSSRLSSICIEINKNLPEHQALIKLLSRAGFSYDPLQVSAVERRSGQFTGCAEYFFRR